MIWVGHVARIREGKVACRVWVQRPEEERSLGRPSVYRRIILK